uniref:C2H2-type domain-containing protein n=1 Tax=Acrobeloides nanus TaxID=290746 RepID=A0A914D1L6_9BILA
MTLWEFIKSRLSSFSNFLSILFYRLFLLPFKIDSNQDYIRRDFICEICGKSFEYKSSLEDHQRSHSGDRPFECSVCCKGFKKRSDVVKHEKIHTDDYPHKCEICNRRFRVQNHLLRHVIIHTGELPYQCQFCEKRFNRMDNQLTHEINIHDYCGYPKVPAFITKMNENKIKCVEEASESSASPSPSLKQDSIDGDDRLMIVEEIDAPKVEPNLKKFKPNEIEVMSLNPINLDLLKKTTVKTSSIAPKEVLPKFSQIIAKSENQEPLPQASTSTSKLEAYLATSSFKKGYINSYELEQERLRSPSQGSASDHSLSSGLYTEQAFGDPDGGSRRWKRFSADEEQEILDYAEKVVAESMITGKKPNLDGVNVWKRACKEGVCKGRSPVALYGWFMRYKAGKFKIRRGSSPSHSYPKDSTPSTPTTPGVTVMVNAISSSEPLSLADLGGSSSIQDAESSDEAIKDDGSIDSKRAYPPMKQSEMFEMIQQKIRRLEARGEQETGATIERISYLVLGTLYRAYESDQTVDKLIHDEAQCLLKCSRCKEMFDYFSAQSHITELVQELREKRQNLMEHDQDSTQTDSESHLNGAHHEENNGTTY